MSLETLVMLDVAREITIPINDGFLNVAQFLNEKKLNKKYAGNLIIYPSGEVKEIISIKILGYHGASFITKLFSFLNTTYSIKVHLADSEESFQSIVKKTLDYLKNDQESTDPYMPKQNLYKLTESNISSPAQLYAMLTLPNAEDSLDGA